MSVPSPDPKFGRRSTVAIDTVAVDEHAVVVSLKGELDLFSAPELRRALCDLVSSGHKHLVLDAAGVQFIDSTALGVLVAIDRRLAGDQRLVIARPGAELLRVLELTGVGARFPIFATLEDAVLAVGPDGHRAPAGGTAPLTADAALLLGIAATAMPFALSVGEQAERWLRALRRHGEAGALLASLGVQEAPVSRLEEDSANALPCAGDADPVAIVTDHARHIVAGRGAAKVTTTDVLAAVRDVYGASFARVLAAHGVSPDELGERLSVAEPVTR